MFFPDDALGPLRRRVLDYERTLRGIAPDATTAADWTPLSEFIAVGTFERVGTFLEVQDWQQSRSPWSLRRPGRFYEEMTSAKSRPAELAKRSGSP